MAGAYTPGLQVSRRTTVVKERELPLSGKVLVEVGTKVTATTPVLFAELPGDLAIIRIADRLGIETEDVATGLRVQKGDSVTKGELLCEVKTFFGLFTSSIQSPVDGTVEFFTPANAHLGIRQPPVPLTVDAYVDGTIIAVNPGRGVSVETTGAFIQGIFGVGGERLGTILPLDIGPDQEVTRDNLARYDKLLKGAVVIGGARFSNEALDYAASQQAAAVITGSIDATTLRNFVGRDIGVSITGDEEVPLTLIITEGFGLLPISDRILTLARKLRGCSASVNGATQVRAGAVRPEVIVPTLESDRESAAPNQSTSLSGSQAGLDVGSRIRCIRVPYFGALGTVTKLLSQPQEVESGAVVRVLTAKLDNGSEVVVPRANVELLN